MTLIKWAVVFLNVLVIAALALAFTDLGDAGSAKNLFYIFTVVSAGFLIAESVAYLRR